MSLLLFCALFAGALAAPSRWWPGSPPFYDGPGPMGMHLHPYISEDLFDTNRFWTDLNRDMLHLDDMLANLHSKYPTSVSSSGFKDNQYKVTTILSGFEEKDIVVKARDGLLMIQAVHQTPGNGESSVLSVSNLPNGVDANGTWTFVNGVLEIVFPLKENAVSTVAPTLVTKAPDFKDTSGNEQSREEIETYSNDNRQDADVGVMGDNDVQANRQHAVEATTYKVDLKDEVEFVPLRQYQ